MSKTTKNIFLVGLCLFCFVIFSKLLFKLVKGVITLKNEVQNTTVINGIGSHLFITPVNEPAWKIVDQYTPDGDHVKKYHDINLIAGGRLDLYTNVDNVVFTHLVVKLSGNIYLIPISYDRETTIDTNLLTNSMKISLKKVNDLNPPYIQFTTSWKRQHIIKNPFVVGLGLLCLLSLSICGIILRDVGRGGVRR